MSGELPVSGSKNAALPVLAACLLTDEPVILHRIPQVKDIFTMQSLLEYAGAKLTQDGQAILLRQHQIKDRGVVTVTDGSVISAN